MKIAITGHLDIERCFNIREVSNHTYHKESYKKVYNQIKDYLLTLSKEYNIPFKDFTLISGMARGVDEIFAQIAIDNNLKLIIVIPKSIKFHKSKKDPKNPNIKIQALNYDEILEYDNLEIHEIDDNLNKGNYGYFLARNQSMVNLSDYVISFKRYESRGTNDCIERAKEKNKYLGNI